MRRRILSLVAVALCLFLSGCGELMSLYPLYSKDVLATDDNLIGRWEGIDKGKDGKTEKKECCWTFAKSDDGYTLSMKDAEHHEIMVSKVHLVRLGGTMFMDMEPGDVANKRTTEIGFPTLDVHMILRIWIEKDSLRLAIMDADAMKAAEVSGRTRLTFVYHKTGILLTATTEQLQTFFTEHAKDEGLFTWGTDQDMRFTRKR
jgi:hypothetical protein